jgi:hypothetical protein
LAHPIVRQYERRRSRDVALVLDPWLRAPSSEREEGLSELAISLTATAINDIASRGHSRLTVAIASQADCCASGPASALFYEELLARLAELVPAADYEIGDALTQALEAAPRGARLIVISPRPMDDPSLAGSSAELPIDPEDVAWIDTSSEQLAALFTLTQ